MTPPGWDVRVVDSTGSTNADLAAHPMPRQALIARHQVAGRGRHSRVWQSPPGAALTMSLTLDMTVVAPALRGWIPLMAGVALTDAVAPILHTPPQLKWPNDALIDDLKFAGILVEAVGDPHHPIAVVGVGVNTGMAREQIPVPTATSLNLHSDATIDPDALASELLTAIDRRYAQLVDAPDELAATYTARSATLGRRVRIELPDQSCVVGTAEAIDDTGRIVVDGQPFSAGDVTHVRAE